MSFSAIPNIVLREEELMVDCGSPSLSFQNDIINYGFIACTSKCKVSVCKTKCNPSLEFKFTNE